ncbi:MAG: hypothetical protein GY795_36100 [Desulfobacterales bacterium]|nr:hypothetical protein [Desulfobacterales bacterium]
MSVLVDLSVFPVDKGESVSSYVAKAVEIVKHSGLSYTLGPTDEICENLWKVRKRGKILFIRNRMELV